MKKLYNYEINSKNIKRCMNMLILGKKHNVEIRIKSQSDKKKNSIHIFFIFYNTLKFSLLYPTIRLIIKAEIYLYFHSFCVFCVLILSVLITYSFLIAFLFGFLWLQLLSRPSLLSLFSSFLVLVRFVFSFFNTSAMLEYSSVILIR